MQKSPVNNSPLIRQPYEAIMSKVDINVHQKRILYRIFQKVQQFQRKGIQADLFKDNYITIEIDTQSLLPSNPNNNNYSIIKSALKDLVSKVVEVPVKENEKGNKKGGYVTYTGLIASANYFNNNRKISIDIKKELFPYYLELSKGYAKININEIFDAPSVYTFKVYEYICQWRDQPFKIIKLDELRTWLNISPEKKAALIKRDIIEPAKKYLDETKSSIYFTFEDYYGTEKTKGNKIIGFKLYIHHRTPISIAKTAAEFHGSQLSERDKKILANITSLLRTHFGFQDMHFPQIDQALSHPHLYSDIQNKLVELGTKYRENPASINDLTAYTIKSIQGLFEEYLA